MRPFFRSRRPFKLTKGGWIFILYTIGVGAGAINTGNNLLYLVFGIFLGLLLASGVLSDLTLWGLEGRVHAPHIGRSNERLIVPMSVENTKSWFPSLDVRVDVQGVLGGDPVTLAGFVPAINAGRTEGSLAVFHPGRRGVLSLTSLKFSTRFPFGLLEKSWTVAWPASREIFILPPLWKRDPDLPSSLLGDAAAVSASARRGEGSSFFGLREYRPGDPPRRIHWRASAKRSLEDASEWMVREMEDETLHSVDLLWPQEVNAEESEFERFLSYVASLMACLEARRWSVRIVGRDAAGDWHVAPEQTPRFLALVDHRGFPDGLALRTDVGSDPTVDLWQSFHALASEAAS